MGLISIVVIIGGPSTTLMFLLIWSSFAAIYQTVGRIVRGSGGQSSYTELLRDDGVMAKKVSRLLPRLPGEISMLVLVGLAVLIWLFDTKAGFIIVTFAGTLIAFFPLQKRSVWIGPVITASMEIIVFLGCISLSNDQNGWFLFVTAFCFAVHRLIISTEVKFFSPILRRTNFFSWEERTTLTFVLFIVWPPICLILAFGATLKALFSLKQQIRVNNSVM